MVPRSEIIFILYYIIREASSTCRSCQSNFAICYDAKRFAMCSEGVSNEMFSCPDGYVCTDQPEICRKSTANDPVTPSCGETCDQCRSGDKLFACLDETSYAWCFGADQPDYNAKGECPTGYVCNLGSNKVCTLASEAYPSCYKDASSIPITLQPPTSVIHTAGSDWTVSASLPAVTESESTSSISSQTSPTTVTTLDSATVASPGTTLNPRDETAFCRIKKQAGLFRLENDASCHQFILCFTLSGQYLGVKYTCPEYMFFNSITKKCEVGKPSDC